MIVDPNRDQCIVCLEKFWEDSGIVMGVFDFSQPQTLRNLTKWVDRALKQAGEMHPIVVLVGNKKGKIYYPTILSFNLSTIDNCSFKWLPRLGCSDRSDP